MTRCRERSYKLLIAEMAAQLVLMPCETAMHFVSFLHIVMGNAHKIEFDVCGVR
jgi:hypothetical protein